ncbi:MAG: TetR/AcrR family transcriptional regulator [Bacteroidales bacterium]|nr:TetR/AcrR family transcriptional regulator [Bacteroidales bacterium]
MKKIDREQWFITGMKILENDGFSKITIDNLCDSLNITKGAFYHHFKNIDGYIEILMQYWLEQNTSSFIREAEKQENAELKMQHLADKAASASNKSEEVIRGWSYANDIVRSYVGQADKIRLDYLETLNIDTGLDNTQARKMAILQYALLIGMQQLCSDLSPVEFKDLQDIVLDKFKKQK